MSLEAEVRLRQGSLDLDVALSVATGEVAAVLGPNGAGKTTLLRALAGLQPLESGWVRLDGELLEDAARGLRVAPERRRAGVVFQDFLLFPHLSVLENVAFGLRSRGSRRGEAGSAARAWLERVGLAEYAGSRPAQLSGGQAQRVALARALATQPRLLLLDEPLSALDFSTRAEVRRDLRRHLQSFEGTRLVVTHDPLEAVALADRLLVLERGRVTQSGSAREVTERPRSRYVADLVGLNLWRGRARGTAVELEEGGSLAIAEPAQGPVFVTVHPRSVAVYRSRPDGTPRNVWAARPQTLDREGDRVRVRLTGGPGVVAEVTPAAVQDLGLGDRPEVWVAIKATEVSVYPA